VKPWFGALLIYSFSAICIGHEAFTAPAGSIFGGAEQPDWTGTAWAFWWTEQALSTGSNPFDAQANFFPIGQHPTAWYNLLDAMLAAPFVRTLGLTHGYNVFVLFILISTGLSAHALSRAVHASHLASIGAGLVWICSAPILSEISLGRLSQGLMAFLLLGLTGIVRMLDGDHRDRTILMTGLAFAGAALGYWFYGLFLLLGASILWAFALRSARRSHRGIASLPWRPVLKSAAICLMICGLPGALLALNFSSQPGVARPLEAWMDHGEIGQQSFDLNMAILNANWALWPWLNASDDPTPSALPMTCWLVLSSALVLHWQTARQTRSWKALPWALVGLIGFLLSLGPYLKLSSADVQPIPLPYLALHETIPFFRRLWWPDRAGVLLIAGVGVFFSLSLDRLRAYFHRADRAVIPLLLAALLLETAVVGHEIPLKTRQPRPMDIELYRGLEGPLLTLPILGATADSRHVLWNQTQHGQPVTGGLGDHIEGHAPREFEEFVASNSLLAHLSRLSQGEPSEATVTREDVQELIDAGLVWAVVDHELFPTSHTGQWGRVFRETYRSLWGSPAVARPRGAAWRIEPISADITLERTGPLPLPGASMMSTSSP
jgi:hypothetical protein